MSSQSALAKVAFDPITAAQNNAIVAHTLTVETAAPATVHEGKQWVIASEDRIYTRDGSGANVRTDWYSGAGRTNVVGSGYYYSMSTGTVTNLAAQTIIADTDGYYVGYNGSVNAFMLSAGVWVIDLMGTWQSATAGTSWIRLNHSDVSRGATDRRFGYVPSGNTACNLCAKITIEAGDVVWVDAAHATGASNGIDWRFDMIRLGA